MLMKGLIDLTSRKSKPLASKTSSIALPCIISYGKEFQHETGVCCRGDPHSGQSSRCAWRLGIPARTDGKLGVEMERSHGGVELRGPRSSFKRRPLMDAGSDAAADKSE